MTEVPSPAPRAADARRGRLRATLGTHLVAIILAATLPLVLLMSWRIVADGKQQRDDLLAGLQSTAKAVRVGVERERIATRDALAVLGASDTLHDGDIEGFERRLASRGPFRPSWERVALFDAGGTLLFEVGAPGSGAAVKTAPEEHTALTRAMLSQAPGRLVALSVLDVEPAGRGTWLGLATTSADGTRYLLAARTGLGTWQALLEGAAVPAAGGFVSLFDGRRRVLARTLAPERFVGANLPAAAIASMASQSSGAMTNELLGGGSTYVAWEMLPDGDWGVAAGISAAPFDAAQTGAVLRTLGVAAGCLLLGVTAALVVARRVTTPLRRLLRDGGAGGDSSAIEVTEIEQLRGAFEVSEQARGETAAELAEKAAALEKLLHEAEAANRAKDSLLAVLGHELRNPLNAIVTAVEVLRRAPPEAAVAQSARAVVARQARKIATMADDLLDVGRVMADEITLHPQPLDLRALATAAVAEAQPRAGERQHRLTLAAPAPVWVRADASRMAQVLEKLLDNAIKHTPQGGAVSVELTTQGHEAVLTVADNGTGIAPELLARIFEPFVQAEGGLARPAGGLGLGLTLVKRLTELHGGSVQARSGAEGSVFELRLPLLEAAAAVEPQGAALRVGVVDDNVDALAGMRAMLELAGHRVSTAVDGDKGLALLLAEAPDVALVDIGLPGIDGYEVARRVRAAGFRGRLIAVTGYGQPRDRERSIAEGFDAHLVKPIDPERLLPLLRSR